MSSDREQHCPFLNRADHRCSAFFSIERLQHAFEHCFDAYRSCEVYHELLAERQSRRSEAAAAGGGRSHGHGRFLWTTACTQQQPQTDVNTRYVRIRLPHLTTLGGGSGSSGHASRAASGGDGADRYAKPAA